MEFIEDQGIEREKPKEIGSRINSILSRSIIYQWIKEFKESTDMDTLFMTKERSDKGTFPSLTTDQKEALLVWRGENPYRTVKDLRDELFEHTSTCVPSVPSESVITTFTPLEVQSLLLLRILRVYMSFDQIPKHATPLLHNKRLTNKELLLLTLK